MNNYDQLSEESRVWIYQSSSTFDEEEIATLNQQLANFSTNWVSHNQALKSFASVFHNQFIVLMVDESQAGASGCSIDKSVHFIKQIEQRYGVNLFDRMSFAYKSNNEIINAGKDTFAQKYQAGEISDDTLVFDNLVKTKSEFEQSWLKPLKESWHKRFV